MADSVNVQTIMQEIRERIRQRAPSPPLSPPSDFSAALPLPEMSLLETVVRSLEVSKSRVGELPPQPHSFRGRLGALLVKIVRRALFWYTPQIRQFQADVVLGFEGQLAALRTLAAGSQQNRGLCLDTGNNLARLEQALGAEAQAREQLAQRLEAERAARAGIEHVLRAETGAREQIEQRLESERGALAAIEQRLESGRAAFAAAEQSLAAEARAREQLAQRLETETAAHAQFSSQMTGKSRQLEMAIQQLRAENSHQSARISILLEETRKRSGAVSAERQTASISDEDDHKLDGFYAAFEDRFRGSQTEITERLRFYLPWLEKHQIGSQRMPILDLGCGRGEWLNVLSDAGLEAYGVDTNRVFTAQCRERGLHAIEADALQHLRGLPDGRFGAITGFHIIEHLALDILVKLIDETVRVLKPGGLAIFETPNPQNVLVGSSNFYLDPTHRNPIPCLTAQFLLEARGLCNVEIVPLHPFPETFQLQDGTELSRRFNEYFYGPQDYAVIGRRV